MSVEYLTSLWFSLIGGYCINNIVVQGKRTFYLLLIEKKNCLSQNVHIRLKSMKMQCTNVIKTRTPRVTGYFINNKLCAKLF